MRVNKKYLEVKFSRYYNYIISIKYKIQNPLTQKALNITQQNLLHRFLLGLDTP